MFVHFVRTYIAVVSDTKISAGNHSVFAGERPKNFRKFDFSREKRSGRPVASYVISSYCNIDAKKETQFALLIILDSFSDFTDPFDAMSHTSKL